MKTFYKGGFLNGQEIRDSLDDIFLKGTVKNPDQQIQQAGIDLTLKRVLKTGLPEVEIPADSEGWIKLEGHKSYWVELNEFLINDDCLLMVFPRSTLFRAGVSFSGGRVLMDLSDTEYRGLLIYVSNPHGIMIQRDARIAQALVRIHSRSFTTPHSDVFQISKKLTVYKIFRYARMGKLGISEKDIDVVEEIEFKGPELESCFIQFKEKVNIGPDEVIVNHHDIIASGSYLTGAIADPGYEGRLHGCLQLFISQDVIKKGMTFPCLKKIKITPVATEDLYDGSYQGLGKEADQTVNWI